MTNRYSGPEPSHLIGVNVQAHGPHPCQYGIQVHDWENGHFEKGIGLNGKGKVGLDLGGRFDAGIHTHSNSIRLDEGACIELDGEGKIKLRYKAGRIEFLSGEKRIGHISTDGKDHEL